MIKVKHYFSEGVMATIFPSPSSYQSMAVTPLDDPFEPSVMSRAEHEANDALQRVRDRSAPPLLEDEERFLCNLLFVVLPQYASCGKREPVSTYSHDVGVTFRRTLYTVVPLDNREDLSPSI